MYLNIWKYILINRKVINTNTYFYDIIYLQIKKEVVIITIIIEGCDGTGKTTLIKKLKSFYGIDSIRLTYRDPKDFNFYYRLLEKTDCIFDRNFLSEVVYADIFNRKCELNTELVELLINKVHKLKIPIFILDTDLDTICKRLLQRGDEEEEVLTNITIIKKRFIELAQLYNIEVIDTTKVSFKEIIKKIQKEVNKK